MSLSKNRNMLSFTEARL